MSEPLSQNKAPSQPPEGPPTSIMKSHPALMMTVIGLGIAIILVLALMVGMIVKRMNAKPDTDKMPVPAAIPSTEPAAANYNAMTMREGTTIADARIEGGLLLLRTTGDDADEVMTFDPKTGQLLARITLKKASAQ